MSQKNRSRKNNKTSGAMEPHADVIRDPSAQEDTTINSVTTAANAEHDKTGNENAEGTSKRFSISNILSKRDTKDVLPDFAGSSSHNGVLTTNSSKDMNFTLELSENLLVECRKLQSSNEAKNEQIESLKQTNGSLNDRIEQLSSQNHSFKREIDSTKDLNWDLEAKLTSLDMECKQLRESNKRTEKSWNNDKETLKNLKTDLEILSLTKNGIENDLNAKKSFYEREISELKGRILNLNNENDKLIINVSELTSEINSLQGDKAERVEIQEQINKARASISLLKRKLEKRYRKKQHISDTKLAVDSDTESATSEEDIFDIVADIDHLIEAHPSIDDLSEDLVKKYTENNNMTLLSNDSYNDLLQNTEKALKPKNDESVTKEAAKNLNIIALPNDDDHNKKEFSIESQIEKLEASGYKVIGLEEFMDLKQSITSPSYDYLREKLQAFRKIPIDQNTFDLLEHPTVDFLLPLTSKIDCLIIPTKEYNELAKASKNPSTEQMKQYLEGNTDLESTVSIWLAEKNDYTLLNNNEYSSMIDKLKSPSKEYLSNKAKEFNQVLIDINELKDLEDPSLDFLKEKISATNYLLLTKEDYEHPSLTYLVEHAKETDHHLLSASAYTDLVKYKESPDIEFLKERSTDLGHTVVSNDEYLELKNQLEHPSLTYLVEHAKETDHHLLSASAYTDLVKYKESPDIEFLKERSTDLGHTVVSNDEYLELKNQLEHPSLTYLVEHAKETDHHLLSASAYTDLVKYKESPDIEFLKERSTDLGHTVVSNDEYLELKNQLEHPSLTYLVEHAKETDHHLLSASAYTDLVKYKESPDIEFLKERSTDLGHTVVSNDEYLELKNQLEHPSLTYLVEHAKETDHHLLSASAYTDLVKYKESPDIEFLKERSTDLGHTVVSNDEYLELKNQLEHPSLTYLVEHAKETDHHLLSASAYTDLVKYKESPDIEFLKERSTDLGHTVVSNDEYLELKNQLEHPSLTYLVEHAKETDHHLLSASAYTDLVKYKESPDIEFLKEKSTSLGHTIVSNDEYSKLQHEYSEAKEQLEHPSLEYLAEQAAGLQQKIVSLSEFDSLICPSLEDCTLRLHTLNYEVIPIAEYENLKNSLDNPSKKYIEEKANSMKLTVIDRAEYETMKDKLSDKDSLIASVKTFGLVPIPIPQLASLEKSSLQNSTLSDLGKRLDSLGYVAITKDNLTSLKKPVVERASRDDALDLCSKFDLTALPSEEYVKMKNESNPTAEELVQELTGRGYVVLATKEHNDMLETLSDPSIDFLKEKCEKYQMIPVDKSIYEKKEEAIESPTYDFISEKALKLGYDLISKAELADMRRTIDLPEIDYIRGKAIENNMVLLKSEEKKTLEDQIEHPSISYLVEKTAEMNKIIIDEAEYYGIHRKCSHPSQKEVEEYCHDLNLVLLHKDEHAALKDSLENPNVDNMKDTLAKLNYHVISKTSFDELIERCENPSLDYLKDCLKSMGYTAMSHQNYEFMVDKYENPQLDYLQSSLAKVHHFTLPISEYDAIVADHEHPNLAYLKEKATKFDCILVDNAEYQHMLNAISSPSNTFEDLEANARYFNMGLHSLNSNEASYELKSRQAEKSGHLDTQSLNTTSSISTTTSSMFTDALDDNILDFNENDLDHNGDVTDVISKSSTMKEITNFNLTYETLENCAEELGYKLVLIKDSSRNLINKEAPLFGKDNDDEISVASSIDINDLSKKAEKWGMTLISDEEFKEYHILKDNTIRLNGDKKETNDIVSEKQSPVTEITNASKEYELQEHSADHSMNKEELVKKAEALDMVVLDEKEYTEMMARSENHLISADDVIREAANFGLVPVERQELEDIKYELAHPTFSIAQQEEHTADHNIVPTTRDRTLLLNEERTMGQDEVDYDDDISASFADESQEIRNDINIIKTQAKKYGMLCIPESAFVVTSYANTPDTSNVVALPVSYYHNLLSTEEKKWNDVNNKDLESEAKKRGFQVGLPSKKDIAAQGTPPKHVSKSSKLSSKKSIVSTKSGIKKGLAEAAATTAYEDYESHPQLQQQEHHQHHTHLQSVSNSTPKIKTAPSRNTAGFRRDAMESFMSRAGSADRAVSLQTLASLNEPSIIPALTQTVIGEYLFKYYPRLGPFGFESRHERFFWIHPYTLTLYWSASNPILENPASTKTKGVAILGVKSVTDPNPYPTGLYHKSIVVTTETRYIKFTCPTRQRHNIWYNSLRYLIQRNMQGISLEDIADDPTDNMYSGKIFPLPGENTKSSNKRLSASRRSVSTRSLRSRVPKSQSFSNLR
ncbi:hypothetical protein SEUBUCD646_0B02740 [Saccharomyces eubayanus]|nr:hypothetical protein SEUBUCD646_0B02740 [Saccharomyces eubayanus]